MFIGEKIMADPFRKMYAEKYKQISLPNEASDKLKKLSKNFKYGKELKQAKTVEAMAWQYNIIKDTDRAIVFRDGKFEVIECDNLHNE
jgi:hypothetical protein